jgi:competence protein ComEC
MIGAKHLIKFFYLSIICAIIFMVAMVFIVTSPSNLEVYFLDVGEGDSILIRTPEKYNILIDGGPDKKVIYKLGRYLPFYDQQIDLMVLTHPHDDHLTGLIAVLEKYKVKQILMTDAKNKSLNYGLWQKLLRQKGVFVQIANFRGILPISQKEEMIILHPISSEQENNLNNNSLVIKFIYQDDSMLLMGDFEKGSELVDENLDLSAEILKTPHHGATRANPLRFLQAVKAKVAIISCGKDNKFKHPGQKVIDNLEFLGAKIYRTDNFGDIHFVSRGRGFVLSTK